MDTIKVIIQLMGGLGLFIYGMKLMGDGLENAAGEGLKTILEKVTSNRIMGVGIGAIVTAVIQSSSATTVMVVGFVNAGLMTLAQAAGVIMGANIGTTITAQLVAFKLDQVAPVFVFVGAALVMFAKAKKRKEIGNIILGFGILFTGMGAMSGAMKPLASSPMFTDVLLAIGDNWFIGIIAGAAITAVLQSSSATTGILIALASTGLIDIGLALPIVFGCNIGTCITAMLASVGTNKTAHKAALLHLVFNIVGTVVFLPFIGLIAKFVQYVSPDDVSRQIANAHTVFNVANTALLLPFTNYIIKFINKAIPCEENIEKGLEALEREAKRLNYSWKELCSDNRIQQVVKQLKSNTENELYAACGYGGIPVSTVLLRLVELYKKSKEHEDARKTTEQIIEKLKVQGAKKAKNGTGVLVKGEPGVMVRMAKCCNPVPGDDIIGYITRGRGVSVHRSDCTSLGHTPEDLERMIEVSWDEASSESFHVGIDIQAYDRSGILMEVMAVLSELKITITNMNAKVLENTKNVMINIVVEIRDISQLDFVMTKLRRIREVYTVQRSKGGA